MILEENVAKTTALTLKIAAENEEYIVNRGPESTEVKLRTGKGSVLGDLLHAWNTRDDDPNDNKKKMLGSAAVAGGLLGAGIVGSIKLKDTSFSKPNNEQLKTMKTLFRGLSTPQRVALAGIVAGGAGGAYALLNRKDDKKRSLGNNVAALGATTMIGGVLADKSIPRPLQKLVNAGVGVGAMTLLPSMAAVSHYGQKIQDDEDIASALHSTEKSVRDRASTYAAVTSKRGLQRKVTPLRYINTKLDIPSAIMLKYDTRTPFDWNSHQDQLYQIVDSEAAKRLRDFEAQEGRKPTPAEKEQIQDAVISELGGN